jgi:hypothetical protein
VTRSAIPPPHADLLHLSKIELHELADGLVLDEDAYLERCVAFVILESQGYWHGRARAMLCRRLKHCRLGRTHQTQLVDCILGRLVSGGFSEQFKDQLRLALHLDPAASLAAARRAVGSPRRHVARYATWVLAHEPDGRTAAG